MATCPLRLRLVSAAVLALSSLAATAQSARVISSAPAAVTIPSAPAAVTISSTPAAATIPSAPAAVTVRTTPAYAAAPEAPAAPLAPATASSPAVAALPSSAPLSAQERALHVLDRIAYGPRPGDLERVARIGAERYIAEQLDPERIPMPDALKAKLAALPTYSMDQGRLFVLYGPPSFPSKSQGQEALKAAHARAREIVRDAHRARLWRAVESPRQLEEVMTEFWFNHFNVFEGKEWDRYWTGNFERTAIRPNALGSFRELLGAVAHHPAMLYYLDNWLSSGADAPAARGRFKGLNENYARELLELHTLGVNGGYTQDDVIALARILTGWTIDVPGMKAGRTAGFLFAEKRHDFGNKVLLGKSIQASGEAEGERALDMLAAHPSTARFVSAKLAQYFIADVPNPELVDRLAQRFSATRGNIRAVLETLFQSPEFWARENYQAKFKTPYQYIVSALRASDLPVLNTRPIEGALAQLGMPLYGWPTPDGYKNTPAAWLNPDAMVRRINFATVIGSGRSPVSRPEPAFEPVRETRSEGLPPRAGEGEDRAAPAPIDAAMLQTTLGPALSSGTRAAVAAAPPGLRAAMILGGPDFMRR